MCTTISIINNKGGVGKTTSTTIIAELLAYLQKRVLVVDLDQQSNLSMMFGCYVADSKAVLQGTALSTQPNIAELFSHRYKEHDSVMAIIKPTKIDNLDIIPCSKRHKLTPLAIMAAKTDTNNNTILKRALTTVHDLYDYILIDNAPANDILTINSMYASDLVICPVRMEAFSYSGLKETIDTILDIKEENGIDYIKFGGVFITQAEFNTKVYKDLRENYKSELGKHFYDAAIRKDIKISEVETTFCSLLNYCPNTNALFDYAKLLLELDILDETSKKLLERSINITSA